MNRYLQVINNGCYKKAPFQKDYRKQLRIILDNGYCQPVGDYYKDAMWSINAYKFDKYDKKLLERLKREEKIREQSQKFRIVYDKTVPKHVVKVDKSIISKGTIMFLSGQEVVMADVVPGAKGKEIRTSRKEICGDEVHISVFENAVG